MPQNEINCIQILRLISAARFRKRLVVWQCSTVLSNEFQKEGPQFLIAQSENMSFVLLIL